MCVTYNLLNAWSLENMASNKRRGLETARSGEHLCPWTNNEDRTKYDGENY